MLLVAAYWTMPGGFACYHNPLVCGLVQVVSGRVKQTNGGPTTNAGGMKRPGGPGGPSRASARARVRTRAKGWGAVMGTMLLTFPV